jgi:hypothetical protein
LNMHLTRNHNGATQKLTGNDRIGMPLPDHVDRAV